MDYSDIVQNCVLKYAVADKQKKQEYEEEDVSIYRMTSGKREDTGGGYGSVVRHAT